MSSLYVLLHGLKAKSYASEDILILLTVHTK